MPIPSPSASLAGGTKGKSGAAGTDAMVSLILSAMGVAAGAAAMAA
jgi:hypothetical protein